MRRTVAPLFVLALFAAVPAGAQDEVSRSAAGGITAPGWMGRVDANEATAGMTVDSARLMPHGAGLHVKTGPAITYWNPANVATGDYTVRATFTEENYMALNSHPHPYGVFIGGNRMGTDQQSYLYCAAYGNGRFIVRGFGPQPFQLNGRGAEHPAVHRAAGPGQPVTQEIAISVRGSRISCAINGTEVASYDRPDVVGFNRLTSTDGVYGLRFGHNTEAMVSGLTVDKGIRVTK